MREKKLASNSIYLICTSSKRNAKLMLVVKPDIPIENVFRYKFSAKITDEMMLDMYKSAKSCETKDQSNQC